MRTNTTSQITDTIYVELDCLLDTRIATLSLIDSKAAVKVSTSGKYHDRLRDTFSDIIKGFDDAVYEDAYKNRTKEVLQSTPVPTSIFFRIRNFIKECRNVADASPMPQRIAVKVNTAPYKLNEAEASILLETLQNSFTEVSLCMSGLFLMTPGIIKSNYTQIVIYDFDTWLNMHVKDLEKCPIPQVQFLSPIIANNGIEKEKAIRAGLPAKAARYSLAGHLELEYLPLKDFSFDVDSAF